MSSYNRRDDLKTGPAAALTTGGTLTGGTVGAGNEDESDDSQASEADRSDGDGNAPEHVWTFGGSHTGIAVADGTVYTGDDIVTDRDRHREGMIALDADDGSVQWRNEELWDYHPTVIGDTLYLKDSGQLHALDRTDGSRRWTVELDDDKRVSDRPVVGDGVVYMTSSNTDSSGALYALETDDGSVRWRVEIDPHDELSAPTPVVGHDAVFLNVSGVLNAFEADDGSVRWQNDPGLGGFNGTPVVDDDHVYVSRQAAFAFDPETGEEVWSISHDTDTSIEVSEKSLALNNGRTITIYDLDTREEIAIVPDGSFFLGDDIAIATREDPDATIAIDLESGDELWRVPSEYSVRTVADDTVYFQHEGSTPSDLVAVDTGDGTKRWELPLQGDDFVSLYVGDEMIVGKLTTHVHAFRKADADDGTEHR